MGSDAGAHSSTACPSDDDSDGSESSGSDLGLRLDPVLSVPVPSREADVPAAHFAHLHRAQQVAPSLLAPPPALPSLTATARRMASLGPQRLLEHRDAAYRRFVAKAEELRAESASLLRGASADVLRVLRAASPLGPHPALLQWCLSEVGWHDTSLIQDILRGFPLVGVIPIDASCPSKVVRRSRLHPDELRRRAPSLRRRALAKHSGPSDADLDRVIFDQTVEEIRLQRMTAFVPASADRATLLTRRFGVLQLTSTGELKVRCIDDFAESMVNDTTEILRAIRMGRVSDLREVVAILTSSDPSCDILLLKSDFAAAYRGCPLLSDHLDFARVVVTDPASGNLFESCLLAMPFGAVAAVYAWDRVGAALQAVLQRMFLLPASRYVDDLFWPDFASCASSGRDLALQVVNMLGFTLAPKKTRAPSVSQDVLGVHLHLHRELQAWTLSTSVDSAKCALWLRCIQSALQSGFISFKDSEQLVGRLGFASWAVWGAGSWAHLRHLQRFTLEGGGIFGDRVRADLQWWLHRLQSNFPQRHSFSISPSLPIILYTDAEGSSGLGFVAVSSSSAVWSGGFVPRSVSSLLHSRKTQIFPFEVIAVWVAFYMLRDFVAHHPLVVFVDNQSALASVAKGTTSALDVQHIVTSLWDLTFDIPVSVAFRFVPSKLNLADPPSRGKAPVVGSFVPFLRRWETLRAALSSPKWCQHLPSCLHDCFGLSFPFLNSGPLS